MLVYNDIDLSSIIKIKKVTGRGLMSQVAYRQSVMGRDGTYYISKKKPERMITIEFDIKSNTKENLFTTVDAFNKVLNVDSPKSIVFLDRPDIVYYGILDGEPSWDEFVAIGKGSLTFVCPDPYAYSLKKTQTINDPNGIDNSIIDNKGTAKVFPTFTVQVLKPITFLSFAIADSFLMLGRPANVEQIEKEEKSVILYEDMSTVTGWQSSGLYVPDGGVVSGNMVSNGSAFIAQDYGTGAEYHGPALKYVLDHPVQDFLVETIFTLETTLAQIGRIELYLLNAAGERVAKLAMKDINANNENNKGEAQIGQFQIDQHTMEVTSGYRTGSYNPFYGMLYILRRGEYFHVQIGEIVNGVHANRQNAYFYDTSGKYQDEVTQVEVHIGGYGTRQVPDKAEINRIKMYEYNTLTEQNVPYIAQQGDEIIIDHKERSILINGMPSLDLKDLATNFFSLQPGETIIETLPGDAAKVDVTWKEKLL